MENIRVATLSTENKTLVINNNFEHSLENMQKSVGGYIEALTIHESKDGRRLTVWLNEEGKINDLPPNFAIVNNGQVLDIVMGNVLITSDIEGETVGLNDEEIEILKSKFDFNRGVILGNTIVEKILFI